MKQCSLVVFFTIKFCCVSVCVCVRAQPMLSKITIYLLSCSKSPQADHLSQGIIVLNDWATTRCQQDSVVLQTLFWLLD